MIKIKSLKLFNKNKTTNAKSITYIKYFLDIILRNKLALAIIIISFLGTICTTVALFGHDVNLSFAKYSILFIGVPLLLLLAQVAVLSIILFSSTKGNNIDLYLNVQEVSKARIVFLKQIAILISSLNIVIGLLVSFVIENIAGVGVGKTFALLFIELFSLLILSFIWISLFASICIFASQMIAIVTSSFASMLFIVGSLMPILFSSNKIFTNDYDVQANQKTIVRAIFLNDNGQITQSENIIYENALAKNSVDFNYSDSFINYSPLNMTFGLAPLFSSGVFSLTKQQSSTLKNGDLNYSTIYLNSKITNFNPLAKDENMILSMPGIKTVFDYQEKTELFNDLTKELLSKTSLDKAKNNSYLGAVLNALKTNNLWNVGSIDDSMKSMIKSIVGIESPYSLAFPIFDNYNLAKNKLTGFYEYLKSKTSDNFASLVEYLWTDSRTKDNIYGFNGNLISKEDIIKYHPTAYSYDALKKANKFDIDFIKNGLFNLEYDQTTRMITNIQILDDNKVFQNIKDVNTVSPIDILKFVIDNDQETKSILESLKLPNNLISTKADFDSFIDAYFKVHTASDLIAAFEKIEGIRLRKENPMDSNYFKNDNLFKITSDANGIIQKIEFKDESSNYKNIGEIAKHISSLNNQISLKALNSTLGTNLTTIDSWNQYIDQNSTINNLEAIVTKIQSLSNGDSYHMAFANNIKNFMSIISQIELEPKNRQNLVWLYLLLGVSVSIVLQLAINRRMTKGDIL